MPGRNYQSSSSYRYGMNDQEKDDEIAEGIYTAKYWEYDSRLGRRWNVDPVMKYWRNSYDAFDNNPIWKIDPNGDDDFFNSDGSYSHSSKKGSAVMVITAKGTVKLSEYGTYDAAHRKAIGNIATYYAKMIGVKGQIGIKPNKEKTGTANPAFTVGQLPENGAIYLNSNGGLSKSVDDANSLTNILWHEKNHQDGKGNSEYSFDHIDIYLKQIDEKSFKNATDDYKHGLVGGVTGLLQKAATDELDMKGSLDETMKYVNEFNKKSKDTGVYINAQRQGQLTTGDTSDDKVIIKATAIKK